MAASKTGLGVGTGAERPIEIAPPLLLHGGGLRPRIGALLAAKLIGFPVSRAALLAGGIVLAVGERGLLGCARGTVLRGAPLPRRERKQRQSDELQSQRGLLPLAANSLAF
jgi:hypothetical protein